MGVTELIGETLVEREERARAARSARAQGAIQRAVQGASYCFLVGVFSNFSRALVVPCISVAICAATSFNIANRDKKC